MPPRIKTQYPGIYYYLQDRRGGPGQEKVFYAVFKRDGKLYEEKVGRQFADAMTPAKAARIRGELIEGKRELARERRSRLEAELEAEANRWTIDRLWAEYSVQRPRGKALDVDANRYWKHLSPRLGSKEPHELVTMDAERLRVRMLKTHSPQTVKHVLALLKRILRFGVQSGRIDPPSPRRFSIRMPSFDNSKTEMLSDHQIASLLKAAREDANWKAGALVRLALATGMRRSEMLNLQWADVNFESGFITLPRTKSGRVQRVPLNDMAREILGGLPQSGALVFPGNREGEPVKNLTPALRRIRKRAGLPDGMRPLHALRHTFASRLASSGESLYVVQKLLRHADGRMTQRYSHLTDEALQKASAKAGKIMEGAQAGHRGKATG